MSGQLRESSGEQAVAPAHCPGLVSIVIPCYGGERFLSQAIESCLGQTYREIEVIIVDDASPDRCACIAEAYVRADARVRLLRRETNGGVSRAFNNGFEVARGEYFTRLAQDDVFDREAIAAMVRQLKASGDVALVYCDLLVSDESGHIVDVHVAPEGRQALRLCNQIGLCVMWRRGVWCEVGGFDPAFDTVEDYEYWLRIARKHRFQKCPDGPMLRMRRHESMGSVRQLVRQNAQTRAAILKWAPRGSVVEWAHTLIALAFADYVAAIAHSERGQLRTAFTLLTRSFATWPFPIAGIPAMRFCSRAKHFAVSLLRLCRVRECPQRAAASAQCCLPKVDDHLEVAEGE